MHQQNALVQKYSVAEHRFMFDCSLFMQDLDGVLRDSREDETTSIKELNYRQKDVIDKLRAILDIGAVHARFVMDLKAIDQREEGFLNERMMA